MPQRQHGGGFAVGWFAQAGRQDAYGEAMTETPNDDDQADADDGAAGVSARVS